MDGRQGKLIKLLELGGVDECCSSGLLLLLGCLSSVEADTLGATIDDLLDSAPDCLVLCLSGLAHPWVVTGIPITFRTPASGSAVAPTLGNLRRTAHFQDPSPLPIAAPSISDAEVEECEDDCKGNKD